MNIGGSDMMMFGGGNNSMSHHQQSRGKQQQQGQGQGPGQASQSFVGDMMNGGNDDSSSFLSGGGDGDGGGLPQMNAGLGNSLAAQQQMQQQLNNMMAANKPSQSQMMQQQMANNNPTMNMNTNGFGQNQGVQGQQMQNQPQQMQNQPQQNQLQQQQQLDQQQLDPQQLASLQNLNALQSMNAAAGHMGVQMPGGLMGMGMGSSTGGFSNNAGSNGGMTMNGFNNMNGLNSGGLNNGAHMNLGMGMGANGMGMNGSMSMGMNPNMNGMNMNMNMVMNGLGLPGGGCGGLAVGDQILGIGGIGIGGDGGAPTELKQKLRLEQNRLSAQRSRKRKKILIEELQKATKSLEEEHAELEEEHARLTAEYERKKKTRKLAGITDDDATGEGCSSSKDAAQIEDAAAAAAFFENSVADDDAPALPSLPPVEFENEAFRAPPLIANNTSPVDLLDASIGMDQMEKITFGSSYSSNNTGVTTSNSSGGSGMLFKAPMPASEVMAGKQTDASKSKADPATAKKQLDGDNNTFKFGAFSAQDDILKKLGGMDDTKNLDQQQHNQQKSVALRGIAAQLASFGQGRTNQNNVAGNTASQQGNGDASAYTNNPPSGIEGLARAIAAQRQAALLQARQAQSRQAAEKVQSQTVPMRGSLASFRERLLRQQMRMNGGDGGQSRCG